MRTNFSEIIPFLGKSLKATIIGYKIIPLTAIGEHFGSTMLSVQINFHFNHEDDRLNEVNVQNNKTKYLSLFSWVSINLLFLKYSDANTSTCSKITCGRK